MMKTIGAIRSIASIAAIGALAAGLAACDGQATPDYQGVPLAQLKGTISTSSMTVMPPDLLAGLSWVMPSPSMGSGMLNACGGELVVVTPGPAPAEVPVKGSFPARFALDVFNPPPPEMIEKEGIARAEVVVFEKATGKVWGTTTPDSQLVYIAPGFSPNAFIGNADFCMDWATSDYWDKNPHVPGYYLLQATKDCLKPTGAPGPGVVLKAWQEAPQGLTTDLTIDVKAPPDPQRTAPCPSVMQGGGTSTVSPGTTPPGR